MAEQKLYIGSLGPYLYDDVDLINDPDGDFNGQYYKGMATTGEGYFGGGIIVDPLKILDLNDSNILSIVWNEDDTIDRILNVLVSGADRSLTISGNSEVDQSVATTGTPTFVDLILSTPTYTMFNLSDPGINGVPQWNFGTSSWEWTVAGITDLSGFTTDDLTEGSTNLYFPGFTDLSTDYGFTDNSTNWDTAYGWGDHSGAGYLDEDSTGVTGNWIINSDLGDVTSTLTFGRTTGGSGTISYDGVYIKADKNIWLMNNAAISWAYPGMPTSSFGSIGIDSSAIMNFKQLFTSDDAEVFKFYGWNGSAEVNIFSIGNTGIIRTPNSMLIGTTSFIDTEKLRVNGSTVLGGTTNLNISGVDGTLADTLYFSYVDYPTTYRNKIQSSVSGTPASSKLIFSLSTGSTTYADILTLIGNGDVGIGTTSPASYLAGTSGLAVYHANYPAVSFANQYGYYLNYMPNTALAWHNTAYGDTMTLPLSGILMLPQVYSHDMNGETMRDLMINDSGELGYDSSTQRKKNVLSKEVDSSWLYDVDVCMYSPKSHPEFTRVGCLAEQVASVVPEKYYGLVVNNLFYDETGNINHGPGSINYSQFIPFIINELKNLKQQRRN